MIDTTWRLLRNGAASAQAQMALDERLAREAVLTARMFQWGVPAISLGWKQPAPAWLDPSVLREQGLECVERPTGGGIAFHGSDVSVSIIVPREFDLPLEAIMRSACRSAVNLCERYGAAALSLDVPGRRRIDYCLTESSPYAIRLGGRKVAGFALRRYPKSWLVQGSLLVEPLPARLAQALPPMLASALADRAVALTEAADTPVDADAAASQWLKQWEAGWEPLLLEALGAAA